MSWSIYVKGRKADVQARLIKPQELTHVTGVERALAESAVNLAHAVVEASNGEKFDFDVACHGSCNFDNGEQVAQAIGVSVTLLYKPAENSAKGESS